ncbi:MAG: NAD(P)/FAD-dependent oxidoreductase [Chloroflexota bacterium]
MSHEADITIIGAGVVGLAVAARLARPERKVYLLEKNDTFGQETSSRNSGVIHSGIYYPEGSLKARLCVAGRDMLYELCRQHGIGHSRLGKLIVASSDGECDELEELFRRGQRNGAEGLRMLSRREIRGLEPNVEGVAAILSPATGIVDGHGLMRYFLAGAREGGAQVVYRANVVGIEPVSGGYRLTVQDSGGKDSFVARLVINCAGLHSDGVAGLSGIDVDRASYRLRYCKGEYFTVRMAKSALVSRLIFPVPPREGTGVGIHVTFDLDGRMRLGPSIEYVNRLDYAVDPCHQQLFHDSAKSFLRFIEYDDLSPETAGIRPKLQGPGDEVRDFVIREESDRGLPGLVNLIGIESPGLTASPAIAQYVERLAADLLAG